MLVAHLDRKPVATVNLLPLKSDLHLLLAVYLLGTAEVNFDNVSFEGAQSEAGQHQTLLAHKAASLRAGYNCRVEKFRQLLHLQRLKLFQKLIYFYERSINLAKSLASFLAGIHKHCLLDLAWWQEQPG